MSARSDRRTLLLAVDTDRLGAGIVFKDGLRTETFSGVVADGALADPAGFEESLCSFISSCGATVKYCLLALKNSRTVFRTLSLPQLPPKAFDKAARLKIPNLFPVALADYAIDYQVAYRDEAHADLLYAGIPSDVPERYVHALDKMKITALAADTYQCCLARCPENFPEDGCVILRCPGKISLMSVAEGHVGFVRDLAAADDAECREALHRYFELRPFSGNQFYLGHGLAGLADFFTTKGFQAVCFDDMQTAMEGLLRREGDHVFP